MDLAEERKKHQLALETALWKAVEVLKGFPGVKQVILFGSYARGRRDLFTDLDFKIKKPRIMRGFFSGSEKISSSRLLVHQAGSILLRILHR